MQLRRKVKITTGIIRAKKFLMLHKILCKRGRFFPAFVTVLSKHWEKDGEASRHSKVTKNVS